jgi:predicted DNA binding CopG/RHH family protein
MPQYAVSVSSDDNMLITKAASKNGLTAEQYCKMVLHDHAESLKEKKA